MVMGGDAGSENGNADRKIMLMMIMKCKDDGACGDGDRVCER